MDTTTRTLPSRPNLEQYKKQAKRLVRSHKAGDADTLQRIKTHHPRLGRLLDVELRAARFALADAQFVLAREHGFPSWPVFAKRIDELTRTSAPASPWDAADRAALAGDVETLERLLREHEPLKGRRPRSQRTANSLDCDYSSGDARKTIADLHSFNSWTDAEAFFAALRRPDSPVVRFEAAVDAIVAGDVPTLRQLLREHPELIHARSMRRHHSTLLIYVGANGVEHFRQETPVNAVEVAEVLLQAGAEVDAVGDMYRGTTTLGLVATSVHPERTGVQDELIDLLLAHGASFDVAVARDYTEGFVINACLANGRPKGAAYLARRGAPLDIEGAAGVGRLDVVKRFFNDDGSAKPEVKPDKLRSAFGWACGYGQLPVVKFLMERGIDASTPVNRHGETGLHLAALGAQVEIVALLLERHAPVNATEDTWGGTPLGWALHGWSEALAGDASVDAQADDSQPDEEPSSHDTSDDGGNSVNSGNSDRESRERDERNERYHDVVARLVAAGATVRPEWAADETVRAHPQLLAALGLNERVR